MTEPRASRTGRVGFALWRSPLPSGGNRYDEELIAALRRSGLDLRVYPVPGPWPLPGPQERLHLAELLAAEQSWIVGNIVASAVPATVRAAVEAGRRITVLLHYFPADDLALSAADRRRLARSEPEAVRAASAVVVTSRWAAGQVASRYGRGDVVVAVPGTDPAPLSPGSTTRGEPPHLVWLGRISRSKDPVTFVAALARLSGLPWTAELVGPDMVDDALRHEVAQRIDRAGLSGRVRVSGPRTGATLDAVWAAADLLVHTSRAETYGLVVAEALARGVPSVVATGTGAVEAQRAGAAFPPGDDAALAAVLRDWLTRSQLRRRWHADALAARTGLATWDDCAAVVQSALTR